jgi:hypothetical protein
MTRKERIDQIITAHNNAIAAMVQARTKMTHRRLVGLAQTIETWAREHDMAADAQDLAIKAALEANRAALALLREED